MSEFKVTGTITSIEEVKSGTSNGKEWARVNFVVNTGGEHPADLYFTMFGVERVDRLITYNKVGDNVEVSFDPRSRQYDGKWYNDFNAWKVWTIKDDAQGKTVVGVEVAAEEEDDLPF